MIELNQMVMHYMIDYVCVPWYARADVRDSEMVRGGSQNCLSAELSGTDYQRSAISGLICDIRPDKAISGTR